MILRIGMRALDFENDHSLQISLNVRQPYSLLLVYVKNYPSKETN